MRRVASGFVEPTDQQVLEARLVAAIVARKSIPVSVEKQMAAFLRSESGRTRVHTALTAWLNPDFDETISDAPDFSSGTTEQTPRKRKQQTRTTGAPGVGLLSIRTSKVVTSPQQNALNMSSSSSPSSPLSRPPPDCLKCDLKDLQHFLYISESLEAVQSVANAISSVLGPAARTLEALREYYCSTQGKGLLPVIGSASSPAKGRGQAKLQAAEAEVVNLERRHTMVEKRLQEIRDAAETTDIIAPKQRNPTAITAELDKSSPPTVDGDGAPLLPPSLVVSRVRNDLVLPMVTKVLSYNPSQVAHVDELARWMLSTFVDQQAAWELFGTVPEQFVLRTARRLVVAADPRLVTATPSIAAVKTLTIAADPMPGAAAQSTAPTVPPDEGLNSSNLCNPDTADRSTTTCAVLPDLSSVLLKAASENSTLPDLALFLQSEAVQCNSMKPERARQIFYSVVCAGLIELLPEVVVSRRRWFHDAVLHVLIGSCPNHSMIQLEFDRGPRCAALASETESQRIAEAASSTPRRTTVLVGAASIGAVAAEEGGLFDSPTTGMGMMQRNSVASDVFMEEASTSGVDIGLDLYGFPCDGSMDGDTSMEEEEALCVGFSFVSRAPLQSLAPRTSPYYSTDAVQFFGERAFAPLTDRHHVSIRSDTPVYRAPGSSGGGTSGSDNRSRFYYFEVHASLRALTSGDDCLRVGWCNAAYAADGRHPAMLGTSSDSIGFSIVPTDVLSSVLRKTPAPPVAVSRNEVQSPSHSSMTSRGQRGGTTSRFSSNGSANFVAVKHFNGHSQRHCSVSSAVLQISSRDAAPPAFSFTAEASVSISVAKDENRRIAERCSSAVGQCRIATNTAMDDPTGLQSVLSTDHMESSMGDIPFLEADNAPSETKRVPRPQDCPPIEGEIVVIGCLLDIITGCTAYAVNGVDLGVAFDELPPGDVLYPAVSISQVMAIAGGGVDPTAPMAYFAFGSK